METGVMLRSVPSGPGNEESSNQLTNVSKRSRSSSETSSLSSVDESPNGDLPPRPEGPGTVRRKPAKRSLRTTLVTFIDLGELPREDIEKSPPSTNATQSGTPPESPSTPVTPQKQVKDIDAVLATPPPTTDTSINGADTCPFPLQPIPIIVGHSLSGKKTKRRCISAGDLPITPPTTPDRFIANRTASHDASKSFHVSKSTQHLSSAERLLRQNRDSPDPFRSPSIARQGRPRISSGQINRNASGHVRVFSGSNLLQASNDPLNPQNRQISTGAVWNVGGAAAIAPSGPINGVPDGRGGVLGSGTNAPMYTSRFFERNTPDQDRGRLKGRLAVALDIDQASRVLNHSQSPDRSRGTKVSPGNSSSKSKQREPRTVWRDGQWVREGAVPVLDAPQLRDDYYCSVLAYSYTSRTLAVGLSNRVYLWSEGSGVQYPELRRSDRRNTYVTSLSFSSSAGGHSILAMGRNDGHLSLWSLHDRGVRFETQLPTAVACLAFKPITTRRPSTRFGSLVDNEELLVGDELGNVYYYSLEWMTDHQTAIHGWNGALKLMAKISVHTQQICGLAWSPDGEYFASGANDNACCLFNVKDVLSDPNVPSKLDSPQKGAVQTLMAGFGFSTQANKTDEPFPTSPDQNSKRLHQPPGLYGSFSLGLTSVTSTTVPAFLEVLDGRQRHKWLHSAAIKAIAFCPWQRGLLATGGGSNDRAIHFYHTFSGACLATIDVQAQVTSLIWSTSRREIAATFGYAQPEHPYRIAVFSWPECRQVVAIPWASEMRALLAIPYPGGPNETSRQAGEGGIWWSRTAEEGCIVVASSDESVKFHEIWTGSRKSTGGGMGLLGGSDILESLEGIDKEGPDGCVRLNNERDSTWTNFQHAFSFSIGRSINYQVSCSKFSAILAKISESQGQSSCSHPHVSPTLSITHHENIPGPHDRASGALNARAGPGDIELNLLRFGSPKEKSPQQKKAAQICSPTHFRDTRSQNGQKEQLLHPRKPTMKFSHSIQFNSVPDWSSHYINYSNLKKLIYTLEKTINRTHTEHDAESSPLIGGDEDPDIVFQRALDAELEKMGQFYELKELEIYGEVTALLRDEESYEEETEHIDPDQVDGTHERGFNRGGRPRHGSMFQSLGFAGFGSRKRRTSVMSASIDDINEEGDSDDDPGDMAPLNKTSSMKERRKTYDASAGQGIDDLRSSRELPSAKRRPSQSFDDGSDHGFASMVASGMTLKKRTIGLYVSLCELKSFIQLNKTGFSKACKKYDKTLDRNIKSPYVKNRVNPAYPFRPSTMQKLDENIEKIERTYAKITTKGDISAAKRELRLNLREHVVWERNTVWREMIGVERKAQAANMGVRRTLLGGDHDPSNARLQGDEPDALEKQEIVTPVGRLTCPRWLFSSTFFTLVAIVTIFIVLLVVPIMKQGVQQNCLALVIFVSLLWATEVIPLFVTALLVPFLAVVLQVVRSDDTHHRLDPKNATKYVFAAMWTPVIMLLLGGFTIAAALSKYSIAKLMATFVLSKAGTRPRTVLLTNMFVALIASMWISNVAAPVLCFSIIQPLLRNLPADSNFSKALILGIALASNIGGAASPIASPQNIIALQNMRPQPSWGIWFLVALPICILSILLIWLLLLATFQPGKGTTIVPIRPMKDKFTGVQWFISFVTIVTIVLWCVTHQLENVFGDMGVVAIIPIVLFFGTGILTKEDFNNFLWTIIILAAGGLSLGKAVSSSGLLDTIAKTITEKVEGMSLYGVLVVFTALCLVVATFISHTVAALIILPLVHEVGAGMKEPHPNLLVMGSALMCSAAMGLPTSGFPNMTAIMMEDPQTGHRYLRVQHFLTRGIPSSIITFAIIISVGYGLLLAAGL